MSVNMQPGTLVEHQDWGRGKVLLNDGVYLTVHFPSLRADTGGPERKLRVDAARVTVASVQTDPLLDAVSLKPSGGAKGSKVRSKRPTVTLQSLDLAIESFRLTFPGGFSDANLMERELTYKREAHDAFVAHFGEGRAEALLAKGDEGRIADALDALWHATNIPSRFEIMAVHDGLKDGKAAAALLRAALEFVQQPGPESFDGLANAVASLPAPAEGSRVLTWPNTTILPFLADPSRFIVLKPQLSRRMAARMRFDLPYSATPTWHAYDAFLEMSRLLLERLAPLGARDFIDVQSFMWVMQETP